jgi:hypothetical protein
MKKQIIIVLLLCVLLSFQARSQGCIAVRNLTGFGQFGLPQYNEEPIKWLVNVNTRYSEFHKTFIGSEEVPVPPEDQPFSNTFIIDFAVTRIYDHGWSVSVDIPLMTANRRTYQEHGGVNGDHMKHTTSTFGLSDIRITGYKWLYDVTVAHKGNIQVGLGVKLPTGDYRYQDFYYQPDRVTAPVNLTLQLGDGGTGFTTEVNAFYTINQTISLYGNLFYLFSPRDMNGTISRNTNGQPYTQAEVDAGANVNSVPDGFTARGGANFTLNKLVLWGGIRLEGSPVRDVIGASNGLRRGGYAVSVEPGLNYKFKNSQIFLFVPLPIYKTMNQTLPDKALNRPSRGGMADYLIFLGTVFKI